MNLQMKGLCLATLGAAATLLAPASAEAANIGYYEMCAGQGVAWQANVITAAGHTPVMVTVPDAAGLSGLGGFFVSNCDNDGYAAEYTSNLGAINNAVTSGGMTLILHDRHVTNAAAILPNAGSIVCVREYASGGSDINFPAGSPVVNGPGGPLNDASLDGYSYSSHGYVGIASLPAGSSAYAVRADASRGTLVNYPAGAGRVVYSTSPLDAFIGGGNWNAYAANVVASITYVGGPVTTCASEGYTGTQLTWCQNICEKGYTGSTLSTWIRRWTDRYRTLPYCAAAPQPTVK